MNDAQPSLFGDDQPDLFAPQPAKPEAYRVKPQHVLNRFIEFDAILSPVAAWPWDEVKREEVQGRTWPYLLAKLREIGCEAEAAHWQAIMAAHAARLDNAAADNDAGIPP